MTSSQPVSTSLATSATTTPAAGSLQSQIIETLGVHPTIDPAAEVAARVDYLANYLRRTGAKGYVLGISGGQDSTLAGKLAQLACAQVPGTAFYAVRLPHGVQADEADAQVALRFIAPDHTLTVNIAPATAALDDAVAGTIAAQVQADTAGASASDVAASQSGAAAGYDLGDFNRGNLKARLRMTAQYAIAGEVGALVLGTDHAAENVTGFFTKWGDGAADLLPLEGLNKRQGAALLRELGAPESTWRKVPTADLEDNKPLLPDEEALGISYSDIDDYLEGKEIAAAARERLESLWIKGTHKRHMPQGPATSADA